MTTIEISARPIEKTEAVRTRFDLLGAPARVLQALARKIEERRTLHRLYQLDAHLLTDMGFDAEAIYDAYEGGIGSTKTLSEILKR
jgi:uncharacterized protein YjiS (DUF1127 family)